MAGLLLGIDVGTTSTKGLVCDLDGHIVAESSAPATLYSPQAGWAEEDTQEWWANLGRVIRSCLDQAKAPATAIEAVGISGMVPTLILVDSRGNVLRRSIQQNDARAYLEIEEFRRRTNAERVLLQTGSPITQQSIGPKVAWLRRHEPQVVKRTAHIMGSYDWMAYRLTGNLTIERNWALESGLFSLAEEDWDDELLGLADIDRQWLGPVHRPSDIVGKICDEAAAATGLAEGMPVVAGSADHIASAFAAGLKDQGDLLVKLGGAGDILYCLDQPMVSSKLFLDYHLIPGKFVVNGCMAASGSILKWFCSEFASGESLADLDAEAEAVGAGDLVLLPYFLGEKTPLFDTQARGVLFGLTLSHRRAHVYRAILEGIACGFNHHLEILKDEGLVVRRARVADGGARSRVWKQIVADMLGLALAGVASDKGSALGVAFVAGMGVGAFGDWGKIDRYMQVTEVTEPDMRRHEHYQAVYRLYREIYEALKDKFAELARIREGGDGITSD